MIPVDRFWGAGRKGKEIAAMLLERSAIFKWCCETPSKWGHDIYGVKMESPLVIDTSPDAQIILAVSSPDEQAAIHRRLLDKGLYPGKDFYWFC